MAEIEQKEVSSAFQHLEGLLSGILLDNQVTTEEIQELSRWCDQYRPYGDMSPFVQLLPYIDRIVDDGVLSTAEIEDLKWFVDQLSCSSGYRTCLSAAMQRFEGILQGILADGEVNDKEISTLTAWLDTRPELAESCPYRKLRPLLDEACKAGSVSDALRSEIEQASKEILSSPAAEND